MQGFGRKFRQRRNFRMPKPVNVGDELDVEILETGAKGDGLAKKDNFVIFVPGTQKGEKVHIRIVKVLDKSAIGEVVQAESSQSAEKLDIENPEFEEEIEE
ncbi:MAG: TRAM domain-containing protein [archaeon]